MQSAPQYGTIIKGPNEFESLLVGDNEQKKLTYELRTNRARTAALLFFIKAVAAVCLISLAMFGWKIRKQAMNEQNHQLQLATDQATHVSSATELRNLREKSLGAKLSDKAIHDQITYLPGLANPPSFLQFAGYLDVSDTKHNFYWFTESERDPINDPVVLWTNGGPGCSGFIGFMGEMGPFRPTENALLQLNSMAWNKIANMVYIEQPCGVGFSYSDKPDKDYTASDETAAVDNLQLVIAFLDRYPHLKKNKLYLAGESYAGHYLPTWAYMIVTYNDALPEKDPKRINFAGFLVGNPYTDPLENLMGIVGTYWGHQLVPEDLFQKWFQFNCITDLPKNYKECGDVAAEMFELVDSLDPYALDYEVCLKNDAQSVGQAQRDKLTSYIHGGKFQSKKSKLSSMTVKEELKSQLTSFVNLVAQDPTEEESILGYEPCSVNYMTNWINQPSVKSAIHARQELEWRECSNTLNYNYMDHQNHMEPIYLFLKNGNYNLNIMVFSGDDDSVCGTIGTQSWVWELGYAVIKKWSPWHFNGQVAGFELRFDGLRFATVHGAGHEVPAFKPGPSLQLFNAFLEGTDLDVENLQPESVKAATKQQFS